MNGFSISRYCGFHISHVAAFWPVTVSVISSNNTNFTGIFILSLTRYTWFLLASLVKALKIEIRIQIRKNIIPLAAKHRQTPRHSLPIIFIKHSSDRLAAKIVFFLFLFCIFSFFLLAASLFFSYFFWAISMLSRLSVSYSSCVPSEVSTVIGKFSQTKCHFIVYEYFIALLYFETNPWLLFLRLDKPFKNVTIE